MSYHITESDRRAGHFESDIKAADTELLHSALNSFAFCSINSESGTHFTSDIEAIVVQIGNNDTLSTCKSSDSGSHSTDKAGTCDKNILAEQRERECCMRSITEWVHNCSHIIRYSIIQFDYIRLRDTEVFSKSAVSIYAYTDTIFADMFFTATAVTAVTTSDMAFTGNSVTYFYILHSCTNFSNDTNVFMTDSHRSFYCFLTPFIPFIDMEVCTADCSFFDFNEDVVNTDLRHWNIFHPNTFFCLFFY